MTIYSNGYPYDVLELSVEYYIETKHGMMEAYCYHGVPFPEIWYKSYKRFFAKVQAHDETFTRTFVLDGIHDFRKLFGKEIVIPKKPTDVLKIRISIPLPISIHSNTPPFKIKSS